MNIREYTDAISANLEPLYGSREARSIALLAVEHIYGVTRTDIILDPLKEITISVAIEASIARLYNGEPIQYVFGKTWFCGMEFAVNSSVLIPRPETEELVEWVVNEWQNSDAIDILDIGTGSGCIAVSLAVRLPGCVTTAIDFSVAALETAKCNARNNNVSVQLIEQDALVGIDTWSPRITDTKYDVIVSNPPYIPNGDTENIDSHVLGHEPHSALFPDGGDALIFYKAIAKAGAALLKKGGMLYFEIYSDFACEVCEIVEKEGYLDIILRNDINSKARMVRCTKR